VRGRAIILAVGASATIWGCGSEQPLACSGNQISREGPGCTPGARLRLTGTGQSVRPVWRGYFDAAGPRGWLRLEARPGRLRVVRRTDTPAPVGNFTVRPGDLVHNGQRAELVSSLADTGAHPGSEEWYAWSTLLPRDLHPAPNTTFNVITQFHHTSPIPCDPSVELILTTRISPPRLQLWVSGGAIPARTCVPQYQRILDLGSVRLGRWDDFVLHIRWSSHPGRGLLELTRNGRRVVEPTHLANLYLHQRAAYLKQGFYRQASSTFAHAYQTGVTRFVAARPGGP
jgi:hypothetical protein